MATYASLADLKAALRLTDVADDAQLQLALDAATEAIDLAIGTTGAQLSPVPAMVKLACEMQATRWYKRTDAPFGVLGGAEFGNATRLLSKLDPDVEVLLSGYGQRKRYGTAY